MNDINNYELKDGGKRLTSFLGEKWIDSEVELYSFVVGGKYYQGQYNPLVHKNRIFNTSYDRQALAVKLHEVGEWILFENYCSERWNSTPMQSAWTGFAYWLLVERPDRFCWLVNQWLNARDNPPATDLAEMMIEQSR